MSSVPINEEYRQMTDSELTEEVRKIRDTNPEQYKKDFQKMTLVREYCESKHYESWMVLLGEVRPLVVSETEDPCFTERVIILVPLSKIAVVYHRGWGVDWYFDVLYVFTVDGWITVKMRGEPWGR